MAAAGGRVRLTMTRGGPVMGGGGGGGRIGAQSVSPSAGSATAPATGRAADDERDVHGPVGAGRLAELAGAVERIDDPDPVGGEAGGVVLALLGEHGVAGGDGAGQAPT